MSSRRWKATFSPRILRHRGVEESEAAHAAADAVPLLNQLNDWRGRIETDPLAFEAGYRDFLELQTIGALQSQLSAHSLS